MFTDSFANPFDALVAQGQRKIAAAAPGVLVAGEILPAATPAMSGAHRAVLGALDELLAHVTASAGQLPMMARTMLTVLTSSRGMLVDSIAGMPEAQLRGLMLALRDKIDAALDDDGTTAHLLT